MRTGSKRSKSQHNHTHSFIDYKVVPKQQYKKSYKNVFDTKPEEHNYLYRHLKNQKIITAIFAKIFKKPPKKTTQVLLQTSTFHKTRAKTSMSEFQSQEIIPLRQRRKYQQKQQTIKRVCSFNQTVQRFEKSLDKNKKRMSLFNKFNQFTKEFQNKLPKDLAQQTRQSIQQNQKLIKICIEQSVAKNKNKQFRKRYDDIMDYSQPFISSKIKQQFMTKRQNKSKNKVRQQLKNLSLLNSN